jgi:hypothetical protein
MSKKDKKIFYLSDDKVVGEEISAGGVILYRFKNGNMELLLVENRGLYEDLGGRVDKADKDIYSTVAREANEESNKLLSKSKIKKRIKDAPFAYMKRSKYIVYIIKANTDEIKLKSIDFGDKEIHDDIFRKVKWIPLDIFLSKDIIAHKLNFRLKNKSLFTKLIEIKKTNKLGITVFTDSSDEPKPKIKK